MAKTFLQITQQKKDAQGSALILALFIIIILTFLGVALMRVLSTSSETIAQEVIGTRALMAANSGMQAQLQKLFPLNSAVSSCPSGPIPVYDFTTIDGLYHCKATTECSKYFTDTGPDVVSSDDDIKYYRLKSTGECGTGNIVSSRTIQAEARSL